MNDLNILRAKNEEFKAELLAKKKQTFVGVSAPLPNLEAEIKQELEDSCVDIFVLKQRNRDLRKELASQQKRWEKTATNITGASLTVKELKVQYSKLKKSRDAWKQFFTTEEAVSAELRKINDKLQGQARLKERQLDRAVETRDELKARNRELRKKNEELEKDSVSLATLALDKGYALVKTEASIEAKNCQLDRSKEDLREKNKSLGNTCEEYRKRIEVLENRQGELLCINAREVANVSRLKENVDELIERSRALVEGNKQLYDTKRILERGVGSEQYRADEAERKATTLRMTCDGLTSKLSKANTQIERLKVKLDEAAIIIKMYRHTEKGAVADKLKDAEAKLAEINAIAQIGQG